MLFDDNSAIFRPFWGKPRSVELLLSAPKGCNFHQLYLLITALLVWWCEFKKWQGRFFLEHSAGFSSILSTLRHANIAGLPNNIS